MVHIDPTWFEAAGTGILAAETGAAMHIRKQAEVADTPPPAPLPPTVVVNSITGVEYLFGMCLLALAMLGAALIIHHGLTA
jgi:hypothetical protein